MEIQLVEFTVFSIFLWIWFRFLFFFCSILAVLFFLNIILHNINSFIRWHAQLFSVIEFCCRDCLCFCISRCWSAHDPRAIFHRFHSQWESRAFVCLLCASCVCVRFIFCFVFIINKCPNYFSSDAKKKIFFRIHFSSAINLYCFQCFFFPPGFSGRQFFHIIFVFLLVRRLFYIFFVVVVVACFIICLTLFVFTYAYNVWYFAAVTDYDRLTDIGHNTK